MSQKRRRLSRSAEFDRVYRHGRSAASRYLVLYAFPREDPAGGDPERPGEGLRLGVSVGKRVGGAVERNRVKRLLREGFWSIAAELGGDHDFVIVARAEAGPLAEREGLSGIENNLRELTAKLGLNQSTGETGQPA